MILDSGRQGFGLIIERLFMDVKKEAESQFQSLMAISVPFGEVLVTLCAKPWYK